MLRSLCGQPTLLSEHTLSVRPSVRLSVPPSGLALSPRSPSLRYAIRESGSKVKIFKNFKEKKTFKPEFGADSIFGGQLLGVVASGSLSFYDWDSQELVRRIEIVVKHVSTLSLTPSSCQPLLARGTPQGKLGLPQVMLRPAQPTLTSPFSP